MIKRLQLAVFVACGLLGTSCINEDMSDCGADYRIDYVVKLNTNLRTNITEELNKAEEQEIARLLREALDDVFSDRAHDVDIAFYTDHKVAHAESHIMDGNSSSFTVYLPVDNYRNLAVANRSIEPSVTVEGSKADHTYILRQVAADTFDVHQRALFTSRLSMNVEDRSQVFNANLYMQNSVAALVIDHGSYTPSALWGCVEGMATSFALNDSLYAYNDQRPVRTVCLHDGNHHSALYSVHFPSRNSARSSGQSGLKDTHDPAEGAIWTIDCYVTLDNKTTKSTLYIKEPLPAGDLKIIKAKIGNDGEIVSEASDVAVSVELNWKPGGEFNPEI